MSIKLGVVMDPIGAINYKKDSTLAMLLAAQQRGWELYYMEQTRPVSGRQPLPRIHGAAGGTP